LGARSASDNWTGPGRYPLDARGVEGEARAEAPRRKRTDHESARQVTAFYSVFNDEEAVYFLTKREAVAYAKELAADPETISDLIEVDRCEAGLRGRALVCAALNGGGWVVDRSVVASIPKRKGAVE